MTALEKSALSLVGATMMFWIVVGYAWWGASQYRSAKQDRKTHLKLVR